MLGEEPSPFFFSRIFSQYKMKVEEANLTPTQQSFQAQQMLEINERFGREVFTPDKIIENLNIQGKGKILEDLRQQQQQAQQMQEQQMQMQYAFEEAKLKELYSRAVANIAMARERHGRSQSNIGLLEERLSEISKNQSLSVKTKMEALETLLRSLDTYGNTEAKDSMVDIEKFNNLEEIREDEERIDVQQTSQDNEFIQHFLSQVSPDGISQMVQ